MKTSEQINELAEALAKAQGELKNVTEDTQGYGYQYATLDQIVDVARPVLAANGIAWLQDVSSAVVDGLVVAYLKTRLIHASGQWLESDVIALPLDGGGKLSTAQHFGSVSTYQRRYQLAPLLGIAAEADDDAAKKDEPRQRVVTGKPATVKLRNEAEAEYFGGAA